MEEKNHSSGYQFGTFAGVYLPSLLTILGVVMFMRLGYVVGELGVTGSLLLLAAAESIAIATGLSISAISTNTPVKSGGPYFLISRSLGPSFGSSIGLTYYLSQSLSVPFYIIGFFEALASVFPVLQPYILWLELGPLFILFAIATIGADWAVRTQFFISLVLALSIVSFLGGAIAYGPTVETLQGNMGALQKDDILRFISCFAIFFPAVTGFLAGVNMSGDLANPRRAIPRGTLAAILTGAVIYLVEILCFGGCWSREAMRENCYGLLVQNALLHTRYLVLAGMIAATLSSALGTLTGAPRILQAFAADRIFRPLNIMATGRGKNNDPLFAMILTLIISAAIILWSARAHGGNALNTVAELVTMFTLCTYAIINLSAAVESFAANPSFRPQFRLFHWTIGLYGAAASVIAAFLINPALLAAVALVIAILFLLTSKSSLQYDFADARRGYYFENIRRNMLKLATIQPDPKNWRPQMAVLAGDLFKHQPLIEFATLLNSRRGILSVGRIVQPEPTGRTPEQLRRQELQKMEDFAKRTGLVFFPTVAVSTEENFDLTLNVLLQTHSIGPLAPNIILCGWPNAPERVAAYCRHIQTINSMQMNCLLMLNEPAAAPEHPTGTIDIWWRGMRNGSLMLVLAYLLTRNPNWRDIPIRILRLAEPKDMEQAHRELESLSEQARISSEQIVLPDTGDFAGTLRRESAHAAVIFIGFLPPKPEAYQKFYEERKAMLADMPVTFLIASAGDAKLSS